MTLPETESNDTLDVAVSYLNSLLVDDPGAIHSALCARVPVNDTLRDHPFLPVHKSVKVSGTKYWYTSLLDILNGLLIVLGVDGMIELDTSEGEIRGIKRNG